MRYKLFIIRRHFNTKYEYSGLVRSDVAVLAAAYLLLPEDVQLSKASKVYANSSGAGIFYRGQHAYASTHM